MLAKSCIVLFVFWLQWQAAVGQDMASLDGMTGPERLTWVRQYVDRELNQKDSVTAFKETNMLLDQAKKWDAPELTAEVYGGQSRYLLEVRADTAGARRICEKGLDFALDYDLEVPAACLLLQKANICRRANQSIRAYQYYSQAHEAFALAGFALVPRIDRYEYEMGRFLSELGENKMALDHLSVANQFPGHSPQVRCEIFMLMASCSQKVTCAFQPMEYFHKCLQLAQKENYIDKMVESSIGVGECHLQEGEFSEARIYLTTGYNWAEKDSQLYAAARALILLSKVNVQEGNLHAAAQKLTEAEGYIQRINTKKLLSELYNGWMNIYESWDNYREAYRYRKLYDHLEDSIKSAALLQASANIQLRLEARV
ncbi:MAG: hypothetical protein ABIQ93_03110, partial [Saprospiraceae bacterium]